MKTFAAAVLLLAAWCAPLAPGQAAPQLEVVTVGVFTVAPFVIADGEGARGVLIDFFDQEVAPRMGVRFRWRAPMTVARLEQSLIHGSVAFTPILARTPEREAQRIVFGSEVHVRFEPCIAVLPGYPLAAIGAPADLAGMTIGWVQAGAMPPFLRDAPVRLDLIAAVGWERANLDKLRAGRIHGAFFSDAFTPQYYAMLNKMPLKVLKLPAPGTMLYGAFAPSTEPALVARYEKAAREAFAKGRWEAYLNKTLGKPPP